MKVILKKLNQEQARIIFNRMRKVCYAVEILTDKLESEYATFS